MDNALMAADAAWTAAKAAPGSVPAASDGTVLAFRWANEVNPPNETGDFVEDLFIAGQLSVAFGGPGAGKSFLLVDCGLHLAMGWEWFGRAVERGAVVYCAGEGGTGIERRIAAWRQHHNISDAERIPFALIRAGLDLRTGRDDTDALISTVKAVESVSGLPVRLLVIDTLARAIAGGDENTAGDMGALILNFDKVREATGVHVCAVHHSGKDMSKGARGHNSLKGAVDTEIEITRDDTAKVSTVRITKQRDLDLGSEFSFRLYPVSLGTNSRGKLVTSCVVEPCEEPATKAPRLSPGQSLALDQLRNALIDLGQLRAGKDFPGGIPVVPLEEWRVRCESAGILSRDNPETARKAWQRIRHDLQRKGVARIWNEWVWAVGHAGH